MKIGILDVETTTSNKGNPFDITNSLVCIGYLSVYDISDSSIYYITDVDFHEEVQKFLDSIDMLVGHNIKFDIHWLIRCGFNVAHLKLWDTSLYEYSRLYQRKNYISLNDLCDTYGFQQKLDEVKERYWNNGIDTDKIPRDVLTAYLKQDLLCTKNCFKWQWERRNKPWFRSFRLDCLDLWSSIEMEKNGTVIDVEGLNKEALIQEQKLRDIETYVNTLYPEVEINLSSPDQKSALLYGGIIKRTKTVQIGYYKVGQKAGQPKYQKFEDNVELPQIYTPPDRSELAKKGSWSTSEGILLTIKTPKKNRKLLESVISYAKINKLIGSYLRKMPLMLDTYHWSDNTLHGQYSHGITLTSRLASDKPNSQNFPEEFKNYVVTRYL